jgi:hypothetical protein
MWKEMNSINNLRMDNIDIKPSHNMEMKQTNPTHFHSMKGLFEKLKARIKSSTIFCDKCLTWLSLFLGLNLNLNSSIFNDFAI